MASPIIARKLINQLSASYKRIAAVILFILILPFARVAAQHGDALHGFPCGETTLGPGLPPGSQGLVDRFNYPWEPGPWLTKERPASAPQSLGCGGFRIDFEDEIRGTGRGFDDRTPMTHSELGATTLGAVRRRTFCKVFEYLGSIIDMKGSPDVIVVASQSDGSGFLAAASPFFRNVTGNGFMGGTMFDHITTGIDPTPTTGEYDARIIFDFGQWPLPINSDWREDPGTRLDLYSITLHEATHTLGFLSLIAPNGAGTLGGLYSTYDAHLHDADGESLIDPSTRTFKGSPDDLLSNSVTFRGSRCESVEPVYSPASYQQGSSLSHFDSYRSQVRYVMHPSTAGGEIRALTYEEQRALCEIGYSMKGGICGRCRPIGEDDTASTFSGVEICVDVLANDIDPEGGALTIEPGSALLMSGVGTVVVRSNMICFTPPPTFTGTAYITYIPANSSGPGVKNTLRVWVRHDRRNATGLDSGLTAYWSFDDSTAADNSGNGNHGNSVGGPAPAPGVCGSAFRFDGINDYIQVPKSPGLMSLKRMTVTYWIKFYKTSNGAGNTIGNGSDDRPSQQGFYTYSGREEISHFLGRQPVASGIRTPYDATVPLDEQEYVFISFVVTDDSLYAYKNGCLVGTADRRGQPISRDWDWFIAWSGDGSGDGDFLNGYMDEIRLYDRPLSHEEIMTLYEMCGGKRGVESDPPAADFGVVECPRTDSVMVLTLRNISTGAMKIAATLRSGRSFSIVDGASADLGEGEEVKITLRFHPDAPGYFTDSLLIEGDCGRLYSIPLFGAHDSCAVVIGGRTDMVIAKSVNDTMPFIRQPITYTITLTNTGPNARRVEARDVVPLGLTVTGFLLSDPTALFDMATGVLIVPKLDVGGSVRLDLHAVVDRDAPDVIINCAEITDVEGGDLDFTNNRACAPIMVRRDVEISDIDFGSRPWCLDTLGRAVLRNNSNDTVSLDAILPSASNAFVAELPQLPLHILPGESIDIPIRFIPGSEGEIDDRIDLIVRQLPAGSPDTVTTRLRGSGAIVHAQVAIDDYYLPQGSSARVPVRLVAPLDQARVHRLRITVRYDSTFLHLVNGGAWGDLRRGTLLGEWTLRSYSNRRGTLILDLEAPRDGAFVKDTGSLIILEFISVLGERIAGRIEATVEALDRGCAAIASAPGMMRTDSICGMSYRLIELIPAASKLALRRSTPNPFSGATEIAFTTPLDGHVRLEVFDNGGRRVALLLDRELQGGEHAVVWDAGAMPIGIYECRLRLEDAVRSIRLVLVK